MPLHHCITGTLAVLFGPRVFLDPVNPVSAAVWYIFTRRSWRDGTDREGEICYRDSNLGGAEDNT